MIDISEILNNDILWQMSIAERASILYLLNKIDKRSVAIEIGSYKGGFLRILSKYFDKVYSCDIDHSNVVNKEQYKNVVWVEGDSKETLPKLIKKLNKSGEEVNFILIDGDHSYDAVLNDIHNVLTYQSKGDSLLLIHDSWYEDVREAVNRAEWNTNPYVSLVEKDFVVGDLIGSEKGNYFVGGLALATMSTEKRQGDIDIKQSQDYMYRVCKQMLDESKGVSS